MWGSPLGCGGPSGRLTSFVFGGAVSEKGKNTAERSKGAPKRHQREQEMRGERELDEEAGEQPEVEEFLREKERKPNRK